MDDVMRRVEAWLAIVEQPGRGVTLSFADQDTLFALHGMLCELEIARRREEDYRAKRRAEEQRRLDQTKRGGRP